MTAPTAAEIVEALNEYADFEEVASVSRARSFATAATRWLAVVPGSAGDSGSTATWNAQIVHELLKRARAYIAANGGSASGGVRSLSVREARR